MRVKTYATTTHRRHSEETKRKLSDIGRTKIGILNNNFKGWWEIESIRYESLSQAEMATGVRAPTIRKRCLSDNFTLYVFISKDNANG